MRLVGLDCATQPANTGLALATLSPDGLAIHDAHIGRSHDAIVDTLADWLGSAATAVLALDAPLGWPAPMGTLATHAAGDSVDVEPNTFFRRETDRVVQRATGKTPLDVGADRIARTALAALTTLAAVRRTVPVAMGWTPGAVAGRHAIEVYPAATLLGRGLSPVGYKPNRGPKVGAARARRAEIIDALDLTMSAEIRARAVATDHVLDAILCCVAAADYATGDVLRPADQALARREGWIWIRDRGGDGARL